MRINLRHRKSFIAIASALAATNFLHAQVITPQIEQALRQTQSEISRQRAPQPLPEQKDLDLLVAPPTNKTKPSQKDARPVDIAKVRVVGSTVLTPERIKAAFDPLQGTNVDLDDLRRVADQLESVYQDAGYFLTRVFVPLQQSKEGGFEIKVVEGYIRSVLVQGGSESLRLQVQDNVQKQLIGKKPLMKGDFDKAQSWLNDIPESSVSFQLQQTNEIGASELVISLKPRQSVSLQSQAKSNQLPSLASSGLPASSTLAKAELPTAVRKAETEITSLRVPQPLPEAKDYEIYIQQTEKTPVTKAVDELQFDLAGVRVEGSSYYSADRVNAMFASLVGKKVSISDLRNVAEQLENQYREDGFFLTRVFLPPQQVKNGVFEIRVIEGYVSAGFAEGGNDLTRARMEGLLKNSLVGKKPLSLTSLERTLLIANEFPGYAASSMLRQGSELGTSELVATMVDIPGSQNISINNNSSNVTGPWGYAYSGIFNNKLGRGEQISVGVNAGSSFDVLKSVSLKYAEPLGYSGLMGSVGVLLSEAHPAGSVASLKIASVGSSITPRLRYPLMRTRDNSVYIESGLTINKTETTIDGAALTLDQFTVWDANVAWLYKTQTAGAGNARLSVSQGVPYFGAMPANATNTSVVGFDSNFQKWTYGLQHTFPLSGQLSLQVSMNGQATSNTTKLLSGEQISFGGSAMGRGYDSGTISGDSGIGGLIELRYDLGYRNSNLLAPIQLYVFADVAEATSHANLASGTASSYKAIASQGLGARFVFVKNMTLDVQYANAVHPFVSADTRSNPRVSVNASIGF